LTCPTKKSSGSTNRTTDGLLVGQADVERDLIRTRTAEGRSRAQERGQNIWADRRKTPAQKAEARKRRAEGTTLAELARSYGVGKSTISGLKALV
jgi:DNA invertase Pin-like site-specific DNA recombinase